PEPLERTRFEERHLAERPEAEEPDGDDRRPHRLERLASDLEPLHHGSYADNYPEGPASPITKDFVEGDARRKERHVRKNQPLSERAVSGRVYTDDTGTAPDECDREPSGERPGQDAPTQ